MAKTRFHRPILFLLAAVSLLAYLGLVRTDWLYGTLRDQYTPQTIVWYLLAFAAFVGLLIAAEKISIAPKWVWGGAVTFRLLLLLTTPSLSDDVYRYMWDGYVATNGVSPYTYPINAPELDYLDIPQRAQANNAWMASPYLPAAQWIFASLAFVFPLNPFFFQAAMIVFDLLSAVLIVRLLKMVQLPPRRLLIYLWNPLVIVEVAHGAHIDAWMIFLTLLAVWLTFEFELVERKRPFRWQEMGAPLFLALATLTKIMPVLILPVLFWRWHWRQRFFYGLTVIGLLLPSALRAGWGLTGSLDGTGLFGALRIYGRNWKFNSGLFHWLENFLHKSGAAAPLETAKLISGVLILIILFCVWLAAGKQLGIREALRVTAVAFIAYILLTPTVHPWYILIILAFLPFLAPSLDEGSRHWFFVVPWLYFSGTLIFSYLTYLDPLNFGELEWVRRLEWLPTLILLLAAIWKAATYTTSFKISKPT